MEESKSCYSKLSVCNLGAAMGGVWAISMFLLALLAAFFDVGTPIVDLMGSLYVGYDASVIGAFIGFIWGFIDGYIGGILIAMLYNFCQCRCPCKSCQDARCCSK